MDGWSYGTNLRTKKIGIYPLSTTSLIHGIHSKFILINCSLEGQLSLFGFDLFHPALAAFQGEHIRVENIVQREKVEKNENLIGNLGFGRFNADFMQSIIQEEESGQVNSYHRKFFICGPSGFNDSCCDILLNDCQVPRMEVLILGNSTFVK